MSTVATASVKKDIVGLGGLCRGPANYCSEWPLEVSIALGYSDSSMDGKRLSWHIIFA